jgi:hypothetical protein
VWNPAVTAATPTAGPHRQPNGPTNKCQCQDRMACTTRPDHRLLLQPQVKAAATTPTSPHRRNRPGRESQRRGPSPSNAAPAPTDQPSPAQTAHRPQTAPRPLNCALFTCVYTAANKTARNLRRTSHPRTHECVARTRTRRTLRTHAIFVIYPAAHPRALNK